MSLNYQEDGITHVVLQVVHLYFISFTYCHVHLLSVAYFSLLNPIVYEFLVTLLAFYGQLNKVPQIVWL